MKIRLTDHILWTLALGLTISSCAIPRSTQLQSDIKGTLPTTYALPQDSTDQRHSVSTASTPVPWKQFFTDSTLVALIDTALHNNQDLKMTIQQITIAKSNVTAQTGALLPSVTAGGSVNVHKPGRYTSEGSGNATTDIAPGHPTPEPLMNYQFGLSADWEVDLWHKLRDRKDAAIEQYLATIDGKNFVLSSLIASVAGNYYQLLALDNELDIVNAYIALAQKSLKVSQIQKLAGTDTELAVKKFEAELAKEQAEAYTIKQQITETENNLNLLLGRYPTPITRNKATFMQIEPRALTLGIPSQLLSNRPDIRQAEHELAAAKLNVSAARKEFLPSLNISASLGLEAFNPTYLTRLPKSLAFDVLGGLAGPLINRKAIQANFRSADATQIEALYNYDKTLLNAYVDVCNLIAKDGNMRHYLTLKTKEADTLDKATQIAYQLFENSRAGYLDVLTNQRDALDAKMELIDAKRQELTNTVNMYRSLGGGWQ